MYYLFFGEVMNNNIQWFIYLGFVLGFISRENFNNQSWLFIFQLMQTLSALAIPILLFIWSKHNDKQKEQKQQELYEKQECIDLLISIFPNLSYSDRKQLSAEAYRDILLDLYQKLHSCDHYLRFVLSSKYKYLIPYVQQCFGFLMPIDLPLKDFNFYDSYHSICITYIKRDMQRYINQGYLDQDWSERFTNHREYIDKNTKDSFNE